ncbi:MAG TPA: NAD-binding protein [Elainellaceae cyanobacterium]
MALSKHSHNSFRNPYQVVILGAGFAGLQVAQGLVNINLDVTLIDRHSPTRAQLLRASLKFGQFLRTVEAFNGGDRRGRHHWRRDRRSHSRVDSSFSCQGLRSS